MLSSGWKVKSNSTFNGWIKGVREWLADNRQERSLSSSGPSIVSTPGQAQLSSARTIVRSRSTGNQFQTCSDDVVMNPTNSSHVADTSRDSCPPKVPNRNVNIIRGGERDIRFVPPNFREFEPTGVQPTSGPPSPTQPPQDFTRPHQGKTSPRRWKSVDAVEEGNLSPDRRWGKKPVPPLERSDSSISSSSSILPTAPGRPSSLVGYSRQDQIRRTIRYKSKAIAFEDIEVIPHSPLSPISRAASAVVSTQSSGPTLSRSSSLDPQLIHNESHVPSIPRNSRRGSIQQESDAPPVSRRPTSLRQTRTRDSEGRGECPSSPVPHCRSSTQQARTPQPQSRSSARRGSIEDPEKMDDLSSPTGGRRLSARRGSIEDSQQMDDCPSSPAPRRSSFARPGSVDDSQEIDNTPSSTQERSARLGGIGDSQRWHDRSSSPLQRRSSA